MLEDEGLALFTGSDAVPCASSLHSFDYDMKEATLREMKTIYIEILKKYMDLGVLHIDFHTTPHFGDSKEMETNHIATRGKNMKGALIFLVQDRESRNYKNIAKISDEGAKIVTLRYRSKEMVEAVEHIEDWEVVRINGREKPMFIITTNDFCNWQHLV